jgi:hypothetical protein
MFARKRCDTPLTVFVVTLPEEGLAALDLLDAVGDDAAPVEDRVLVVAEVVADRADDVHVREEARGQREVHGGAAEHALALAKGRFDRVERDGSNDCQGHAARETTRRDQGRRTAGLAFCAIGN